MARLQESEESKKNRIIQAEIAGKMKLYGIDDDTMAIKLRMCRKTWHKRKTYPETMTVKEFRTLVKILHMNEETIASCV